MAELITLRLTEDELRRIFLYLIAPHQDVGEQSIEIIEIISVMVKSAGRQE